MPDIWGTPTNWMNGDPCSARPGKVPAASLIQVENGDLLYLQFRKTFDT